MKLGSKKDYEALRTRLIQEMGYEAFCALQNQAFYEVLYGSR